MAGEDLEALQQQLADNAREVLRLLVNGVDFNLLPDLSSGSIIRGLDPELEMPLSPPPSHHRCQECD